jgi:hypothetical protein
MLENIENLFYKNLEVMQESGHVIFFMFSQMLMVKQFLVICFVYSQMPTIGKCLCYLF